MGCDWPVMAIMRKSRTGGYGRHFRCSRPRLRVPIRSTTWKLMSMSDLISNLASDGFCTSDEGMPASLRQVLWRQDEIEKVNAIVGD